MTEGRLAARRLARRPGATIASVLTLACAIGAASATYSLVAAVLLRPLPIAAPDRLVVVATPLTSGRDAGTLDDRFIYPSYRAIRDGGVFAALVAEWGSPQPLRTSAGGTIETRFGSFVSYNFFDTLGVPIPLGRTFTSSDDRRGAPGVAILTDRYWQRAFNSDPAVIGRTITVADKPVTVIGVAARGFRGLSLAVTPDLFLPLHVIADFGLPTVNYFADTNTGYSPTAGIRIIGLLPPGVLASQASGRLSRVAAAAGLGDRAQLMPIDAAAIPGPARAGMRQFTRLLSTTVALLLLIGCGTAGMLLLVRTEERRSEFAMCVALGASRVRLARGIAIEGALMSIAGVLLAVPVARWLFAGIRAFQLPGGVEVAGLDLSLDLRTVAFAAGAAMLATILMALIAGVFGLGVDVSDALRARGGATPRRTRRRTRSLLVGSQVAVAMVLLAGAGLFVRSTMAALSLNPRFDTARIISGGLSLAAFGHTPARASIFFDDVKQRLTGHPDVRLASMTASGGGMSAGGRLTIDGQPREMPSFVAFTAVDETYFDTLGVRPGIGRSFTRDDSERAPLVAIVSESFGRFIANGGSPLGHRVGLGFSRPPAPPPAVEVVGVVPDLVTSVSNLQPFTLYMPLAQQTASTSRTLVVRAATTVNAARRATSAVLRDLDPTAFAGPIAMPTIDERLARQMSAQQFGIVVLGALGGIAALLTVLGTYVLAESMMVLRIREMGIRAALGATGRQLGAIVIAETTRLVGSGLLAGLGLAWLGASTIRAFLFQVQPLDPMTLGAVAALILTLSILVSLGPALRAARVDLGSVLKEE